MSACDLCAVTLANGWAEPTDGREFSWVGGGYATGHGHAPAGGSAGGTCCAYRTQARCGARPCRLGAVARRAARRAACPPAPRRRRCPSAGGSTKLAAFAWQGRGRAAAPPRRAQRQRAMRRCSEPPPSASRPAHSRGSSSPSAAGDKSHYPYVWRARTYTRRGNRGGSRPVLRGGLPTLSSLDLESSARWSRLLSRRCRCRRRGPHVCVPRWSAAAP